MHPNFKSCSLSVAIYKKDQVLGEIRGEEEIVNGSLWLISATVSLTTVFFLKACVGTVKICSWPGTGTLEHHGWNSQPYKSVKVTLFTWSFLTVQSKMVWFETFSSFPSTTAKTEISKPVIFSVMFLKGADKSLARPCRKQTNVSVRMAWISFDVLSCRKEKKLGDNSRLDVVEIARPWYASELVSFLVGLRTY